MPLDWSQLSTIADSTSADFIDLIKPYLPALAREGPEVFDGFIKHIFEKDWAKVDQLMYAKMTPDERTALDTEVLLGLRAAAQARFDVHAIEKSIMKDLAFKALLRLILLLVV